MLFSYSFLLSNLLNFHMILFFPIFQSCRFQSFPESIRLKHVVIIERYVQWRWFFVGNGIWPNSVGVILYGFLHLVDCWYQKQVRVDDGFLFGFASGLILTASSYNVFDTLKWCSSFGLHYWFTFLKDTAVVLEVFGDKMFSVQSLVFFDSVFAMDWTETDHFFEFVLLIVLLIGWVLFGSFDSHRFQWGMGFFFSFLRIIGDGDLALKHFFSGLNHLVKVV